MMLQRVFFLVVPVALLLTSLSYAQIPVEREENCGSLLSSVISVCSHPTLSRPDWCCEELKRWNRARCWCEPNAFDALDTVAATGAAYSFRNGFCAEEFQRPARGNVIERYATCEPFDSIGDADTMEQCEGINPQDLRAQRFTSLDALRDDRVQNDDDLSPWFLRMNELFTDDANIEVLGIFLGRGRFEVKQYLMTRQPNYGFMPATADFTGDHFWRNPRMVSYSGGITTSDGYFNKREFVTFERCSARIESVYTLEDNYQSRYGQFWNPRETRLMSRYSQTSEEWCADVATRCIDDTYPFTNNDDCLDFHRSYTQAGRVTCNRFEQPYVPQYSIHGDTIACRSFYLDLAVVEPVGGCRAVGRSTPQNRCEETQCPGNAFINPFSLDPVVPQFESTPTHFCSDTECREDWPSRAQIESIPEEERARFESNIEATTSVPNGEPTAATPIPDNDELMNDDFENQPVEQQPQQPVTSGESFSPGSLSV